MDFVNIFIKTAFVENLVLAYFLGMCSYLAVSKSVKTAVGLGLAVIFVLGITIPINWMINEYLLNETTNVFGTDLTFLRFILFIAVIASMVQLVEMVVEKVSPALYNSLGIFLPLITVNCAILGGFGWFLAIVFIAAIREKIRYSNVPPALRGLGMAFLLTGLMGLAFLGLSGIDPAAIGG
jgi:Na+-transporting NADH:ubiquinone oxidoreductase subunit E